MGWGFLFMEESQRWAVLKTPSCAGLGLWLGPASSLVSTAPALTQRPPVWEFRDASLPWEEVMGRKSSSSAPGCTEPKEGHCSLLWQARFRAVGC